MKKMTDEPDDWNEHERALLDALEATENPSTALEARVVAALRERGLLVRSPVRPRTWPALAAAAGLALAIGVGLGRATVGVGPGQAAMTGDTRATTGARTFVLLLYPGAGPDPSPAAEARRVEEYARWARGLAAQGRLLMGEKLKDGVRVVGSEGTEAPAGALQGFFLLRAESIDEAEAIARTCPHRGHGGAIALREVDPT